MKKIWSLFIFKLGRDRKFRNDTILLSLSIIILLLFAGSMVIFNPQKQQAEKLEGQPNSSKNRSESSTSSSNSQQTTVSSAVETSSSSEESQPSIEEFSGGWGISQIENIFFINADMSISTIALDGTVATIPMENLSLYYTEDGRSALSYVENDVQKEWIKTAEGTLTSRDQIFQSLGDLTIEQYLNGN
ncbi:DUF4950 domain-containing protein [Candidatus Enterococcus clewellii]